MAKCHRNVILEFRTGCENAIKFPSGPHCIKLFAGVFYGKNQETPAKKKSIAICIEICQSFFMAKKCLAKSFMQRGPGVFI